MRKIFVLFLAILIMACFSTASFATNTQDKTGTISLDSGGNANVDLSANVIASYWSSGTTYAAATYNPEGTGRNYGTGSTTTYMWYYESGVTTGGTATEDLGESYDFATNNWESIGK